MSKWRPVPLNCLYVIPDIHGQLDSLKLICNRIFPLRKSDGGRDTLVFLGDYIDRGPDSPGVIDFLIDAKKKFGDQVVCLTGNHEQMLLDAIKQSTNSDKYLFWMKNGGEHTLSSYLDRKNHHLDNPYELPRVRVRDFIPEEHLKFFNSLKYYYEIDDYIFVHAGCNPRESMSKQEKDIFILDESLKLDVSQNWKKIIVTGHNGDKSGNPIIRERYLMLDCSYGKKLIIVEMHSMEAFAAGKNKDKLVKLDLSHFES
jgi:serine/threonine protein phosphatase 1